MQKIALLDYHKKDILESQKIQRRLERAGAEVDIFPVLQEKRLPNVNYYDKFVMSGSDDPHLLKKQSAKKSLDAVFKADAQGKKVLAFCGGYELLAVVGYDMEYEDLPEAECEFGQIFLRNGAKNDSLFYNISENYSVLEVHKRVITCKDSEKIFALNVITGKPEIIKFSKNKYGMQGHPEDTEREAEKVIGYYKAKFNLPERNRLRKADFLLNKTNLIFENFVNL